MNSRAYWNGRVRVSLTGADPERTLHLLTQAGIRCFRICWVDPLTVRFFCARKDCGNIQALCEKRGNSVSFGPEAGASVWKSFFRARPVLAMGLMVLMLLTLYLPTRVLFFRVEGNERIPERRILEAMEESGIRFGASRRAVRSEKMKNVLLEALPELKWAGINTSGCTAVITVREREVQQSGKDSAVVTGIVAAEDGYVTSVTVVKGTGLCGPGQIVKAGQLLISGYTDQGICLLATGAEGEIYAQTSRNVEIVTPVQRQQRVHATAVTRRYSLTVGKKRINLWKDSRISDTTCGRMYEEYYMILPGGFRLPLCLGVETLTHWETQESRWPAAELEPQLRDHARRVVLEQTIAGTILRETQFFTQTDEVCGIRSRFLCEEMIGRAMTQEIGDTNGKTD